MGHVGREGGKGGKKEEGKVYSDIIPVPSSRLSLALAVVVMAL